MKFGKKLAAAMHPEWEGAYVQYKALKQVLKGLASPETSSQAEGQFVGELMRMIQQVWSPTQHP